MNRSLAYVGVGIVLAGIALVASPIVLTGHMKFNIVPAVGLIVAPLGLGVVGVAAAAIDPRRTTVLGTFGQDLPAVPETVPVAPLPSPRPSNPRAPVRCPNCRTVMTYELARCPRCAEDRPCRECGRLLTEVDDRAVCGHCGRAELFCNCAHSGAYARRAVSARPTLAR